MIDNIDLNQKPTAVEYFEFCRRWDEVSAVIDCASVNFNTELELEDEMKQHNKKPKNPWIQIFLVVSIGTSSFLREAQWYEFKWEWNFGSFLLSFCFLYYLGFQIEKIFIKKRQNANFQRLREFEFHWNAATGGACGSFWGLRKFVTSNGELNGDRFSTWRYEVHRNLSDKVSLYSNQPSQLL